MKAGVYEVTMKLTKPDQYSPMTHRVTVDEEGNATNDLTWWESCGSKMETVYKPPRKWEQGFHNCRILPWVDRKKPLDKQAG